MATSYTSLLGFALPVTGELDGTWGDVVNDSITQLVEDSVAGVATADVTSGNWTLSTTGSGAANEARCAIIIPTGTPGVSRNVIAPSQSKAYVVINQSDASIVFKGSATTGVTLGAGDKALIVWNGTDFIRVGASVAGSTNQVQYNSGGNLAGSANLTFDGTTLTAANFADSSLTSGRVTYAGASGNLSDSSNLTFDGTTLTAANFADSSLTSGRVTYAGASGNLTDSANLTFDGTTLTAANFADSSLTSGRVTYAGASGNLTDSANLTFDGANLQVASQGDIRFGDADNSNYAAIQAPATIASNYVLTLPVDDGNAGQFLQTDGSGVLTWATGAVGDVTAAGNNAFTGANTFYNSTGQTFGTGTSTQDGIIIAGRAGGSSSYRVTLQPTTLSGNRTLTLLDASTTIVGTDTTQTLSNKTITQRVSSTTSISSPLAWNSDNFDLYAATAQAGNLTINADAGTPVDGRKIIFRIASDSSARVITFTGAASKAFKPVGVTLSSSGSNFTYTLTASKITYFGAVYNANSDRWEIIALSQEV